MIFVKETFPGNNRVRILADGILDGDTVPILKEVCQRYLQNRKEVELEVKGLIHISREGRDLLQEIQKKITILSLPDSMNFLQVGF